MECLNTLISYFIQCRVTYWKVCQRALMTLFHELLAHQAAKIETIHFIVVDVHIHSNLNYDH